jgi:sorting nexin-29
VETIIGNYECGFRPGKSTSYHLHSVKKLLERARDYGVNTYYMFVDFKAAYDSINREVLLKDMEEFHVPRKLRGLVELEFKNVRCRVRAGGGINNLSRSRKGT